MSGPGGGGTVLIGGDFQGSGVVPQATQTRVDANVRIAADAIGNGNGGRVIVWSKDATRFYGTITAKGGANGGNGGFAEVSGKAFLDYAGRADLRAAQGSIGTLLLDPTNITIIAGPDNSTELAANDQFTNPGVNSTITNGTINSATSNVILQATNDITFNAPINNTNGGIGIRAEAGNSIFVNSDIKTDGGTVRLRAENGGIFVTGTNSDTPVTIETTARMGGGASNLIILDAKTRVEVVNAELLSRKGVFEVRGSTEELG